MKTAQNIIILTALLASARCASAQNSNWDARFATNGLDNIVRAIAVSGSNVYVGGFFAKAGNLTVNGITKWDGTSWSTLGTGVRLGNSIGLVHAIAVSGSNVYVGGSFDRAGAVQVSNFARWDGIQWNKMYDVDEGFNGEVDAIAIDPQGHIYVGGLFTSGGEWNFSIPMPGHLAVGPGRWNAYGGVGGVGPQGVLSLAAGWYSLYAGTQSGYRIIGSDTLDPTFPYGPTIVRGFQRGQDTIIYESVQGYFHRRGEPVRFRTNTSGRTINDFALVGEELYVAGVFNRIEDSESPNTVRVVANNVARFYQDSWTPLGSGVSGMVWALGSYKNEVYIGGAFLSAGGKPSPYFAIWHAPPVAPRISSIILTPEQTPKLSILGRNEVDCRIDWSMTLTNWTPLMTNHNPEGAFDFIDDTAAGVSRRFYRVVHP